MNGITGSILDNIRKVMVGQERVTTLVLTALLAEGHVLLEDMPGMGKTVLASSLAKSINAPFNRIQFTPDLLPSDVTGLNYFNQKMGEFVFREGPAFCSILLADEINRATPRTQSSLLECMGEKQITVDGVTRPLAQPFFVIATQNPIETLGTYPLPEAQLDRFMMRLGMENPSKESELAILNRFLKEEPLASLAPVCGKEEVLALCAQVREIYVHPALMDYVVALCQGTRSFQGVEAGVSPRGSLALLRAVRAYALLLGRAYVVPEDIKALAVPVLAHRIKLGGAVSPANEQCRVVEALLATVPVPTEDWVK